MRNALLVFVGGGLGCVTRYVVSLGIARFVSHRPDADSPLPLPAATLIVNLAGCLLIGLAWGVWA